MKPYTYLLKHNPTNTYYYGVRYQNVKKKIPIAEDLWTKYFTSSPKVEELIEDYGADSFDFEIRRVFDTPKQATIWETKVLTRCKVLHDDKWINANIAGHIMPTAESNKKISDFHKGKPKSAEHAAKIGDANRGKKKPPRDQAYRDNMSIATSGEKNGMYGKSQSEETKKLIGAANKGRKSTLKGKCLSEAHKSKISSTKKAKQYKHTAASKQKISSAMTGNKHTEETKKKMSSSAKGIKKGPMSNFHKQQISKGTLGKKKPVGMSAKLSDTIMKQLADGTHYSQIKEACIYCGKVMNKGMIKRWHGEKCKEKV